MVAAGTTAIETRGSSGSGRVSRVYRAGMKKRMVQAPAPAASCATGAVMAIRCGPWATGAVMAMRAAPRLPPKMKCARRRKPSLRAASSPAAATVVSAARRGA